jgi:hypothetical protein
MAVGSLAGAAAALLLLLACDSGSLPGFQGESCRQASDCNSGLQCLDYSTVVDGGCVSLGLQCLQPCQASTDCGSAGSGFGCYAACGTEAVCQPALPGMQDGGGD